MTRPATAPAVKDEPDGTPEAVAAAARRVVELLQRRQELGEPITAHFVRFKGEASRRLRAAEAELAGLRHDRAAAAVAAEAHLARVRETARVVDYRWRGKIDTDGADLALARAVVMADLAEAKLAAARAADAGR